MNYSGATVPLGTPRGADQVLSHPCLDGLKCFAPDNGLRSTRPVRVEETYCASAETISSDCVPSPWDLRPVIDLPGKHLWLHARDRARGRALRWNCSHRVRHRPCDFGARGTADQSGECAQMTQLCPKICRSVAVTASSTAPHGRWRRRQRVCHPRGSVP